ncbi:hypothetical protein [Pantoea sp. BAV 3049]|uniref:hypothetical protein n=1 Tax=Pantoea sp. BAV 3049 TaxID=2654188 RepID=UPI001E371BAD|nr:hypothetical protein [Pantoea sp. BAV 3049]
MDNYLAKNRFSDYFLTMANLEARQLSNLAAKLADRHLKNAIVRNDFKNDIQNFIAHQLQSIRTTKNDSECRQCVSNISKNAPTSTRRIASWRLAALRLLPQRSLL